MISLLCPVLALGVNVITQVLVFRATRGAHYFRSIVQGVAAGALFLVLFEALLAAGTGSSRDLMAVALLVHAPTYLALSYCAYNFIQLGQSSIRIRMYAEIASEPSGVSVEEMKREYDDQAMMQARLRRLIESGDIVEKEGRYFVGRRRLVGISDIIVAAKRLLLGKASEFE